METFLLKGRVAKYQQQIVLSKEKTRGLD